MGNLEVMGGVRLARDHRYASLALVVEFICMHASRVGPVDRVRVHSCPWKITAHVIEGNVILRVHTYQVNHNHIAQDECSSKVKDFERDHGVQLTYNQAWHLKEKAKERIYGAPRESYTFVPWLCHRLREINPGTIAEYTSDEGSSFVAIAYDADDGMFPLALGVCFELFGIGNHAYCYRHVKENFSSFLNKQNIRGKKGKEDALLLLDSIAYARLEIDYNEAFEKLVRFNDNLVNGLRKTIRNIGQCQSF
ncbi:hypothetical protein CK203_115156 [Vitis vinifera]|uniref:MULE transposase domain-containing protein n=1 Tax=Vitis vinifera TaxID=29760 RepID=A0A438FCU2_VITVI|nr:hypothetical protein CK203_115156 [Vitis vinifera]